MSDQPLDIEALVKAYPLPEGVPDAVLNKTEVAEFFQFSEPTIAAWIRDGMPFVEEGTNGRSYKFMASQCWAWRQSKKAGEEQQRSEARAAIEAMRLKLIGGEVGDTIRALPPKERQQLYDVEAAHLKLCRERNQTLQREDVSEVMTEVLRLCRDGVNQLPDVLEREVNLGPKAVAVAIQHCDTVLEELHRTMERYFADRPIVTREERVDLFN